MADEKSPYDLGTSPLKDTLKKRPKDAPPPPRLLLDEDQAALVADYVKEHVAAQLKVLLPLSMQKVLSDYHSKNHGPQNEPPAALLERVDQFRVDTNQRVGQISVDYQRLLANVRLLAESVRRLAKGKSLGALGIPTEEDLK